MLTACPQSLHVIKALPVMFLIVVYMPQGYASLVENAKVQWGIGTPPKEGVYKLKVKPITLNVGRCRVGCSYYVLHR